MISLFFFLNNKPLHIPTTHVYALIFQLVFLIITKIGQQMKWQIGYQEILQII